MKLTCRFRVTLAAVVAALPAELCAQTDSGADAAIQKLRPVVQAACDFHARNGIWPEELSDLAPDFLPAPPDRTLEYRWDPNGESNIRCPFTSDSHPRWTSLVYVLDGDDEGWHAGRPGAFEDLPVKRVTPQVAAASPGERLDNAVRELDRRSARNPGNPLNYAARTTLLLEAAQWEPARASALGWLKAQPGKWDGRLAILTIAKEQQRLSTAGSTSSGAAKATTYAQWRIAHPSGLDEKREAYKLPFATSDEDWPIAEIAAWEFAYAIYFDEQYRALIDFCDRWEKEAQSHAGIADEAYLLYRAGSHMALGEAEAAKNDAERAVEAESRGRLADGSAAEVLRAVRAGQKKISLDGLKSPNVNADWRVHIH